MLNEQGSYCIDCVLLGSTQFGVKFGALNTYWLSMAGIKVDLPECHCLALCAADQAALANEIVTWQR